jgi:hemolysin activation/secretion protein
MARGDLLPGAKVSGFLFAGTALASSLVFLAAANAQTVPGAVDPGRIEKRFEQPRIPQSVIEPAVPEGEEQLPPEEAEKIRFTLTAVTLDGATTFPEAEIGALWADRLGKEVSLADMYALVDEITAYYRNKGYILSRAIVPPQRINGGIIRIRVVEGHVNDVIIEGEANGRADLFRRWGEQIKASKPLHNSVLERYSLLANDLPGVKARAVLRPSQTVQGASDVVFIIEHKYIDGSLTIDNRGTKTSGPGQYTLGAGINSILGLYEKTQVTWVNTVDREELRYLAVQHDEIVTTEGTKLTLSGNRSRGQPGHNLRELDMRSRNITFSAALSHPLVRSRQENLSLAGSFTARTSQTDQLGSRLNEDRIRVAKIGAAYDYSDAWQGVNQVVVDLHQGLNILNATDLDYANKTRDRGRSDFTKLTLDVSRTQQFDGGFALVGGVTSQWSATQLLSSEEFGYGGSQYGRAYDSSEITGDNGIAGKLELQFTDQVEDLGFKYIQPFVFYDYGITQDRAPTNQRGTRMGSSAGIGLRFGLTDYINGSFEIDKPLTRPVNANTPTGKGEEPRFFFSISARY